METIDTVEACTLEVGDVTEFGTVDMIVDDNERILVFWEDEDEPTAFDAFTLVHLLGMVYSESI